MPGKRDATDSSAAKVAMAVFGIAAVLFAGFIVYRTFTNRDVANANERDFVDAKTGKSFKHDLKIGESVPVRAPSGADTGYPGELCFWTADGKPKEKPTVVLLKSWLGESGPTFCPDCGRLVVGHNPRAGPGVHVPPTQSEYKPPRDRH